MNFKLIPNEAPETKIQVSQTKKRSTKKTHISEKFAKHAIFKKKKADHPKMAYRLLQSLSIKRNWDAHYRYANNHCCLTKKTHQID